MTTLVLCTRCSGAGVIGPGGGQVCPVCHGRRVRAAVPTLAEVVAGAVADGHHEHEGAQGFVRLVRSRCLEAGLDATLAEVRAACAEVTDQA